jgi:hypothetical protein
MVLVTTVNCGATALLHPGQKGDIDLSLHISEALA